MLHTLRTGANKILRGPDLLNKAYTKLYNILDAN